MWHELPWPSSAIPKEGGWGSIHHCSHHLCSQAAIRPRLPCAAQKHWLLLGIEGGTSNLALQAVR